VWSVAGLAISGIDAMIALYTTFHPHVTEEVANF
jgi:hypothetical protein